MPRTPHYRHMHDLVVLAPPAVMRNNLDTQRLPYRLSNTEEEVDLPSARPGPCVEGCVRVGNTLKAKWAGGEHVTVAMEMPCSECGTRWRYGLVESGGLPMLSCHPPEPPVIEYESDHGNGTIQVLDKAREERLDRARLAHRRAFARKAHALERTNWTEATPITPERLNAMEDRIDAALSAQPAAPELLSPRLQKLRGDYRRTQDYLEKIRGEEGSLPDGHYNLPSLALLREAAEARLEELKRSVDEERLRILADEWVNPPTPAKTMPSPLRAVEHLINYLQELLFSELVVFTAVVSGGAGLLGILFWALAMLLGAG